MSGKPGKRAPNYWTPAKIDELRALAATGMTDNQMAEKLGRSWGVINVTRRRYGIKSSFRHDPRIVPEDFAEVAPTMNRDGLARHYRAGTLTISLWCEVAGVEVGKARNGRPAKVVVPKPPKPRKAKRVVWGAVNQAMAAQLDPTIEGRAAHHLRRFFVPVCRLRTLKPKAPEGIWIVGRLEVDAAKLVQMAEAKGFQARWAA